MGTIAFYGSAAGWGAGIFLAGLVLPSVLKVPQSDAGYLLYVGLILLAGFPLGAIVGRIVLRWEKSHREETVR